MHLRKIHLLVLILISAIFRFYHLGYKSIWYDEAISYFISSLGFKSLHLISSETAQPLYFLIASLPVKLLGNTEYGLRLMAVIFGLLSICVYYIMTAKYISVRTAFYSGILLALSPFHIWYSQEARCYTLFLTFTLAMIYYFLSSIQAPDKKKLYFFTLFSILNLYTHYYTVGALFSIYLYILLFHKKSSRKYLIAGIMIILAFLPYFFTATIYHFHLHAWQFSKLNWANFKNLLLDFSPFAPFTDKLSFKYLGWGMGVLAFLAMISQLRKKTFFVIFIAGYFIFALIVANIYHIYHPRFMIILLPFYYLFLTEAVFAFRNKMGYFFFSILIIISLISFTHYESWNKKTDWRKISCYLEESGNKNDRIFIQPLWEKISLKYYIPDIENRLLKLDDIYNKKYEKFLLVIEYKYEAPVKVLKTLKRLENLGYKISEVRKFEGVLVIKLKMGGCDDEFQRNN